MIIRLRPDPHLPGLGVLLEGGAEQGVYVGGVAASAQPGLVPGHQETPDWRLGHRTIHFTLLYILHTRVDPFICLPWPLNVKNIPLSNFF